MEFADRLWDGKALDLQGEPALQGLLRVARENRSWRDACYSVRHVFSPGVQHPGFWAKELVQDLLDMDWIFPLGLARYLYTGVKL